MKTKRIIPRLDIKGQNLVKGVHLEGLRVLGLPERFAEIYYQQGADELIFMDVVASLYGRNHLEELVKKTAKNVFIPITVGGGIRSIENIRSLLRAGADKVAINTAAIHQPELISKAARVFGSQCIVLSIEAIQKPDKTYEAYTDNGREETGIDAVEWAKKAEELGAGEILITSVDHEGTGRGYDLDLVTQIAKSVSIPVIACGGAGSAEDVQELFDKSGADAMSAASIFHYQIISQFGAEKREEGNIDYARKYIDSKGDILKHLKPVQVNDLKNRLNSIPVRKESKLTTDFHITDKEVSPKVAVVDYGRSNLFSVGNALEKIGADFDITEDFKKILSADRLLLAGVGAFRDGMKSLKELDLIQPILDFTSQGKPLLGICLGMQLFMGEGEEFGRCPGLGLIAGKVEKLNTTGSGKVSVKVPHIGWNEVNILESHKNERGKLPSVLMSEKSYYFVHSYCVVPEDRNHIIAETEYGPNQFCSIIKKENVLGCQFHPERSGLAGLKIYNEFVFSLENEKALMN